MFVPEIWGVQLWIRSNKKPAEVVRIMVSISGVWRAIWGVIYFSEA